MGVAAFIAALLGFVGGLLFGVPATLLGTFLLVRRQQSYGFAFRAWLEGALGAGLLWGLLATWTTEFPTGGGPPRAEDWSSFLAAVAMWSVFPGAALMGGGIAQTIRVIFRRHPRSERLAT